MEGKRENGDIFGSGDTSQERDRGTGGLTQRDFLEGTGAALVAAGTEA